MRTQDHDHHSFIYTFISFSIVLYFLNTYRHREFRRRTQSAKDANNCWKCCLLLRILKVYRNEWSSGYIQYTSRGLNIQSTDSSFFPLFFLFLVVPLPACSAGDAIIICVHPSASADCHPMCVRMCATWAHIGVASFLPSLDMCRFCIYVCVCVGLYRWPIKEREKKGETAKKRVWLCVSVAIFLLQFVRSAEKNQYTERKRNETETHAVDEMKYCTTQKTRINFVIFRAFG